MRNYLICEVDAMLHELEGTVALHEQGHSVKLSQESSSNELDPPTTLLHQLTRS